MINRVHLAAGAAATLVCALAVALPMAASPPAVQLASDHGGGQCLFTRNINGFNAPNEHTVYVRIGVSDVFRLDLMSACSGLTFRQGIGIESTPGDPWVCSPIQATVVYRDTGIPQRCPVSAMHKLTAEELAALPKRDQP
jgi:hypothetical protein